MDEGIIRNLDSLGRLVIPKEMRKLLNVDYGDAVRIIKQNKEVVIKRAEKSCIICGCEENLVECRDTYVCRDCVREIGRLNNFL